jgi:hypothetical protein
MTIDSEEFLASYIETAFWSSNDESDERGGEPLDANYGREDLHPDSEQRIAENAATLEATTCRRESGTSKSIQTGHDFWLTRNGHGCGFWDGDYSEPHGTKLTKGSKSFRECYLIVGDDGKVYCE